MIPAVNAGDFLWHLTVGRVGTRYGVTRSVTVSDRVDWLEHRGAGVHRLHRADAPLDSGWSLRKRAGPSGPQRSVRTRKRAGQHRAVVAAIDGPEGRRRLEL